MISFCRAYATGLSRHYSAENFNIAYLDGEAVGCMALVDYDPVIWPDIMKGESLFIHKLAVKRSGAGKGVSKYLIKQIEPFLLYEDWSISITGSDDPIFRPDNFEVQSTCHYCQGLRNRGILKGWVDIADG